MHRSSCKTTRRVAPKKDAVVAQVGGSAFRAQRQCHHVQKIVITVDQMSEERVTFHMESDDPPYDVLKDW